MQVQTNSAPKCWYIARHYIFNSYMCKKLIQTVPKPAFSGIPLLKSFSSHNRKQFLKRITSEIKKSLDNLDLTSDDLQLFPMVQLATDIEAEEPSLSS